MKILSVALILSFCGSTFAAKTLQDQLKGGWALTGLTCKGSPQKLENNYVLRFEGKTGEYISKTKGCTQKEPEIFQYLSDKTISIKSGVRSCNPTPCTADLPATECGKETNASVAEFNVEIKKDGNQMILSTEDPKSVDCIGPGQSKPAVFTFVRKTN